MNGLAIGIVELLNLLKETRRLRDKRALDQKRLNVFEVVLLGERRDIREQLSLRDTDERIADSAYVSVRIGGWMVWCALLSLNIGSQLGDASLAVVFNDRGAALLVLVGHNWTLLVRLAHCKTRMPGQLGRAYSVLLSLTSAMAGRCRCQDGASMETRCAAGMQTVLIHGVPRRQRWANSCMVRRGWWYRVKGLLRRPSPGHDARTP